MPALSEEFIQMIFLYILFVVTGWNWIFFSPSIYFNLCLFCSNANIFAAAAGADVWLEWTIRNDEMQNVYTLRGLSY